MKSRQSFLVFLFPLILSCSNQDKYFNADLDPASTAIWGHSADLYKKTPNKSMAMILNKNSRGICSGVFIHPEVILSAAHCFKEAYDNYTVAVGENPFLGDYFERKIIKWIKHPELDLALVRIDKAVPASWKPLEISSSALEEGQSVVLMGYGESEKRRSGALRSTSAQVFEIEPDQEITVLQTSQKGICFGDSGGPLLIQKNSKWLIAGIATAVIYPERASQEERCQHSSSFTALLKEAHWIFSGTRLILNQK